MITVKGSARTLVPAELATLAVTINGEGRTSEVACDAVAKVAHTVDDILAVREASLGTVSVDHVNVSPKREWRDDRWVDRGWQASRTTRVDVVDLAEVSELVGALGSLGVQIDGPSWSVRDDHAAYDQVRTDAARDARRRAEAYAAGLGLAVGAVRSLEEPGTNDGRVIYAQSTADWMGDTIPIKPAEVSIEAQVEVTFELA